HGKARDGFQTWMPAVPPWLAHAGARRLAARQPKQGPPRRDKAQGRHSPGAATGLPPSPARSGRLVPATPSHHSRSGFIFAKVQKGEFSPKLAKPRAPVNERSPPTATPWQLVWPAGPGLILHRYPALPERRWTAGAAPAPRSDRCGSG